MSASTSNLLPPSSSSAVPPEAAATPAWKREASERLRAHRSRSRMVAEQASLPGMEDAFDGPPNKAGQIAARVAQRYARIPSWREAMAAEAAARAAAEATAPAKAAAAAAKPAAARRAKATAEAVSRPEATAAPTAEAPLADEVRAPRTARRVAVERAGEPAHESAQPWQPELIRYSVSADSLPAPRSTPAQAHAQAAAWRAESEFFDPLEAAVVEPTRLLPARVLEFPRELIAPRKARPRLAEGPLCDEDAGESRAAAGSRAAAESREASHGSGEGTLGEGTSAAGTSGEAGSERARPAGSRKAAPVLGRQTRDSVPEWQSIYLESEEPVREPQTVAHPSLFGGASLHVAPLGDRVMAGVVDIALTLTAFLIFVLVFAACTTHPPAGRAALAGAGIALLAMGVLYQIVFFSLSAATPGMRYARIALCTFDDENPTRRAMRARVVFLLLSGLALGLGFLWALFDENALGWHDRITQTYQRSYRG